MPSTSGSRSINEDSIYSKSYNIKKIIKILISFEKN